MNERKGANTQNSWRTDRRLQVLLLVLSVLALLPAVAIFLCILVIAPFLLGRPSPPGYSDGGFEPREWSASGIGDFLGISLPTDAELIRIDGKKGILGSYEIYPTLEFSFSASAPSSLAFARHFCHGVWYPGFNPFEAHESSFPAVDKILIRGASTIHYSSSPGVPLTTIGNRCERAGGKWIEEFAIDMSNSERYVLTYRLPYDGQASPHEFYPLAAHLAPIGGFPYEIDFPLYVTGLRQARPDMPVDGFILSYPTLCIETRRPTYYVDHNGVAANWHEAYENSDVAIFVDGIAQPSAEIRDSLLRYDGSVPLGRWQGSGRWEYCISDNWSLGRHRVRMVVTPPDALVRTLEWSFTVLEPLPAPTPFVWPNTPTS